MAIDQESCRVKGYRQVSGPKPIFRRPKAIEDVEQHPNHVVFYIERDETIEVIRMLRGGQDTNIEVEKI